MGVFWAGLGLGVVGGCVFCPVTDFQKVQVYIKIGKYKIHY